jgi:hypothetical protein
MLTTEAKLQGRGGIYIKSLQVSDTAETTASRFLEGQGGVHDCEGTFCTALVNLE